MMRIRLALLLAMAPATVLLDGCSGSVQRRNAETLIENQNYDQAVVQLRQLVEQDPTNRKNQILLGEAESKAADEHLAKAEAVRADRRPRDAKRELDIVIDRVPAHPKAIRMVQDVEKDIQRSSQLAKQAQTALDRKDFREAVGLANETLRIDRTLAETQKVREVAMATGIQGDLAQAQEALAAQQWDACLAQVAKVKEIDPANASAAAIEKQAAERKQALVLLDSAKAATRAGEETKAIQPLHQAAALWPENKDLSTERDRVTSSAVDQRLARAEAEASAGHFAAAMEALDQALAISPNRDDLAKRREETVCRWAGTLLERHETQALAGRWELAWPLGIQAAALCPTLRERALQDLARAEEKIRGAIICRIGVIPLKSDTASLDDTLKVCQVLAEQLRRVRPPHVQLPEQANLAEALKNHTMTLSDVTDATKLADLARRLPGMNVGLFIEVSAQESNNRRTHAPGTARYLAGTKTIRNPDYSQAEQELGQARTALSDARSDALSRAKEWDADGRRDLRSDRLFLQRSLTGYYGADAQQAAERYNAALAKLQKTPPRADGEDWREYQYPIYQIEREVNVRIRMRMVELASGRIFYSDDTTSGRAGHSDTMIAPDLKHNVPGKTAVLKETAELQAEATERALPPLQAKAADILSRPSAAWLEDARKGSGDAMITHYVRFLFGARAYPDPSAVTSALDALFSRPVRTGQLESCQRLAADRLNLRFTPTGIPSADATLAAGGVTTLPAPAGTPAEPPRAGAPDQSVVRSATEPQTLALRQPAQVPQTLRNNPGTSSRAPARSAAPSPAKPAPSMTAVQQPGPGQTPTPPPGAGTAQPGRVFDGIASRDDRRYKKEINTVDGIIVKVKDTDASPLDADVEIRVGPHKAIREDLRVGARIPVRGLSGQVYHVVILAIEHKNDSVRIALDKTSR